MPTDSLPPEVEARVRESFAAQAMMRTAAATITALTAGRCILSAPIAPGFTQQHGFAHAGLSFTLGDTACGYAALSLQPEDREVLTSEMKIHLLAPAVGARLEARGEVIRAGRRLVVTRADVFALDDAGKETLTATLLGTIVPVPRG